MISVVIMIVFVIVYTIIALLNIIEDEIYYPIEIREQVDYPRAITGIIAGVSIVIFIYFWIIVIVKIFQG